MLNKFPLWKNLLVAGVILLGLIYAAPNLYPPDPAVQISGASSATTLDGSLEQRVEARSEERRVGKERGAGGTDEPGIKVDDDGKYAEKQGERRRERPENDTCAKNSLTDG